MRALDPASRRTVGNYRLLAELGSGGMGRVHLASGRDGKLVCVKEIHAHLASTEGFRARFRSEIQSSQKVASSPYTASIIDSDASAEIPWLASEFFYGPTLFDGLNLTGTFQDDALTRLAAGLSSALETIHAAGIVHRDLKPSNVLLTDDGLKVIDFGISRAVDASASMSLTQTGFLVGSLLHMSPEQVVGRPVTPASDVFAFGTLLATAATRKNPFDGASPYQVQENILKYDPDLTLLPALWRHLIKPCLAKDPNDRPTPTALLNQIGTVPPRARPWPTTIRSSVESQRVEVAKILDETLVDQTIREEMQQTLVEETEDFAARRADEPLVHDQERTGQLPPATVRIARRLMTTASVVIFPAAAMSPFGFYLEPSSSGGSRLDEALGPIGALLAVSAVLVPGVLLGVRGMGNRMRWGRFLSLATLPLSAAFAVTGTVINLVQFSRVGLDVAIFFTALSLAGSLFVVAAAIASIVLISTPTSRRWTVKRLE